MIAYIDEKKVEKRSESSFYYDCCSDVCRMWR